MLKGAEVSRAPSTVRSAAWQRRCTSRREQWEPLAMSTTGDKAAPYTPRQGQYLAYIHTYTRLHRQPPAEAEIAAFFGVSPPSVHQMVVTLERRGLIARTPGQARSLRVLLPPTAIPDLDSGQAPLR